MRIPGLRRDAADQLVARRQQRRDAAARRDHEQRHDPDVRGERQGQQRDRQERADEQVRPVQAGAPRKRAVEQLAHAAAETRSPSSTPAAAAAPSSRLKAGIPTSRMPIPTPAGAT